MTKKDRIPEVHFYEWSVPRWALSKTRMKLDATGIGVFRELLDLCYAQGSCPRDPDLLAAHSKCTRAEFDRVWPVIKKHFHVSKHDSESLENDVATVFRRNYFKFVAKQRKNRKGSVPPKDSVINALPNSGAGSGATTATTVDEPHNTTQYDTTQYDTIREEKIQEEPESPADQKSKTTSPPAAAEVATANPPSRQSSWLKDSGFCQLIDGFQAAGAPITDEDRAEAAWEWGKLDNEQRISAIDSVLRRTQVGAWDDPAFIPRPKNYLKKHEWNRPIVTPKQNGSSQQSRREALVQRTLEQVRKEAKAQ